MGFLPGVGGDKAQRGPPRRWVPREAYHAAHEKTGLFFRPICDRKRRRVGTVCAVLVHAVL